MLLENKVALITGAASGIGRASAELFAREGAQVVVSDINEAGGHETVENIRRAGGDALFVRTDVSKMEEIRALVQTTVDHFGRLNVLYSNAAQLKMGNTTEISETDWDFTVDSCLKSCWMLCHHAVPHILAAGGGTIVITGSVHALRGYSRYTAYQAAKGGLLALTRALAAEYAPTIRVNTVLPGAVVTGLWADVDEEMRKKIARQNPLRRNGTSEDIANVALFLASEMSAFVTGTHIVADGGLTAIIRTPEEE